jgi:hypothetical protein
VARAVPSGASVKSSILSPSEAKRSTNRSETRAATFVSAANRFATKSSCTSANLGFKAPATQRMKAVSKEPITPEMISFFMF